MTMIAGLVIVGLISHSIAVLAAGGDFLADSLAIILGLIAIHLRDHHHKKSAPTYVALINGLLLLFVTGFVVFKSTKRLLSVSPEVHGLPILIVSVISAIVMGIGVLILGKGAGNEDLHMRSILLDTISDGVAAISVAVVGGIIFFTNRFYWLDSVVAIIIGLAIAFGAVKLLIDVTKSLRSGTPLKLPERD